MAASLSSQDINHPLANVAARLGLNVAPWMSVLAAFHINTLSQLVQADQNALIVSNSFLTSHRTYILI